MAKAEFSVSVDGDTILVRANQNEWGKVGYRDVYVCLRTSPSLEGEATVPDTYYTTEYKRLFEAFGKETGKVILGVVRALRGAKEMVPTEHEKGRDETHRREAAEAAEAEAAEKGAIDAATKEEETEGDSARTLGLD